MRPFSTHTGRWLGVAALTVALAAPALAQRNVTLRMNSATMPDTVAASAAAGVQVRGCLDGCEGDQSALPGDQVIAWNDNTTLVPTNVAGDYWEIDFQIPEDEKLNFKFYIDQAEGENLPGGWEDGANHEIAAGTGDVTLDLHYFEKGADQAYDWRPFSTSGDSVAVWFRVFMNTDQAGIKGLDLADGDLVVGVRGNSETNGSQDGGTTTIDFGATNVVLNRESTDAAQPGYALFSGRVAYPAASVGETQEYKFFFSDGNTDNGWEDVTGGGNRTITIPAQDSTLHWKFFGDSPALSAPLVTANVTFTVDISPLSSIGLFQTTNDEVEMRGGFNGWDCPVDNQDDCGLAQDVIVPQTYANEIPVRSAVGSELQYKFYVQFKEDDDSFTYPDPNNSEQSLFGFEEPLDFGGGNRTFDFAGAAQDLGTQFFNSARPGNVIPEGTTVDVTFQVDMVAAESFADSQGRPFNPAQDTVTVQFEDNFWLLTQGFEPGIGSEDLIDTGSGGNLIRGFKLTDDDGDGIYTGTLTVSGPTYNGIGYRYAFGNDTDGLQIEGSGGFDEGRRRYRYVTDTSTGAFTLPGDGFRAIGPGTVGVPWEINPTGTLTVADFSNAIETGATDPGFVTVANEAGPGREGDLVLSAVYPNPTTGLARIDVTAAAGETVSVDVYDVTGRRVISVLDGAPVAGRRAVTIDTQALSAGVYVVRAESGRDVATRRLTVVR
ncbi:MAG: T9SS type A sorting domain-containing protein [Bacteroidota bacterium]